VVETFVKGCWPNRSASIRTSGVVKASSRGERGSEWSEWMELDEFESVEVL